MTQTARREKAVRSPKARTKGFAPVPPRVDLLPPEITVDNRRRSARRGMRVVIIAVALITLLAVAGAWYLESQARAEQARLERDAQVLLLAQGEFAETRSVLRGITETEAAVRVGGSTDIDWADYIRRLQGLLPADVVLTTVSIDAGGPLAAYEQSTVPLERPRIATLVFSAESPGVPSIPNWINSLTALPGFADASPSGLTHQGEVFTGTVTMHINTDAYSHHFVPEETADATAEGDDQ
ncbi:hypothetical protein [Salinibacterium sp. ZJ70]|uniref:hypothetical protein n=1 Tax=Salinibacterium sp. ZJ70 TaxID=2708084 RepID=UPI0014242A9B|nr:hypothetical protein [Salinibacterium sp. ZJ70]